MEDVELRRGFPKCTALVSLRGCSSRREILDDLVSEGWGQEQAWLAISLIPHEDLGVLAGA